MNGYIGVNLNRTERAILENIADRMEAVARGLPKEAVVYDKGNNEVPVVNIVFGMAWDLKQIARIGTPSFGV